MEQRIKALLIGCGNIGALYDLNNPFIQTHAKCMFQSDWISNIDVYDNNIVIAKKIAKKYNFSVIENYNKNIIGKYNIVCICTPTETHFNYIKDCIEKKVKCIICEKPLSYSLKELNQIASLYNEGSTKILVNYYRRFQKKYSDLKKELNKNKSELLKINFRYYKGLLNFASHGFDTINYLLDLDISFDDKKIISKKYDYFKQDPTVSIYSKFNNIEIHLNGNDIKDPIFEIDLFFRDYKVEIFDLGNKANIIFRNKIKTYNSLIENYMIDVYEDLKNVYCKKKLSDNFLESINLNKKLLKLI